MMDGSQISAMIRRKWMAIRIRPSDSLRLVMGSNKGALANGMKQEFSDKKDSSVSSPTDLMDFPRA